MNEILVIYKPTNLYPSTLCIIILFIDNFLVKNDHYIQMTKQTEYKMNMEIDIYLTKSAASQQNQSSGFPTRFDKNRAVRP